MNTVFFRREQNKKKKIRLSLLLFSLQIEVREREEKNSKSIGRHLVRREQMFSALSASPFFARALALIEMVSTFSHLVDLMYARVCHEKRKRDVVRPRCERLRAPCLNSVEYISFCVSISHIHIYIHHICCYIDSILFLSSLLSLLCSSFLQRKQSPFAAIVHFNLFLYFLFDRCLHRRSTCTDLLSSSI